MLQYPLGLSTELPVFSFLPDTNVPKESNAGAGRLHFHCSSMEEPAMVSSTHIHAYRASCAIASGLENPEAPRERQDSSPLLPEEIPVSCMANFMEFHANFLECYNLFSGVELSMRSFFVISGKACKTKAFRKKC